MPDTVLIGRLSAYGKVFSFCHDRVTDGVLNEVRTAKMHLNKDIPSCIHIVGEFIRVWYPDQPKTVASLTLSVALIVSCLAIVLFRVRRLLCVACVLSVIIIFGIVLLSCMVVIFSP